MSAARERQRLTRAEARRIALRSMELTCRLLEADRESDRMAEPDPVSPLSLTARPGVNLDTGADTVLVDARFPAIGRVTLELTPDQFAAVAQQFADVASLVVRGKMEKTES